MTYLQRPSVIRKFKKDRVSFATKLLVKIFQISKIHVLILNTTNTFFTTKNTSVMKSSTHKMNDEEPNKKDASSFHTNSG